MMLIKKADIKKNGMIYVVSLFVLTGSCRSGLTEEGEVRPRGVDLYIPRKEMQHNIAKYCNSALLKEGSACENRMECSWCMAPVKLKESFFSTILQHCLSNNHWFGENGLKSSHIYFNMWNASRPNSDREQICLKTNEISNIVNRIEGGADSHDVVFSSWDTNIATGEDLSSLMTEPDWVYVMMLEEMSWVDNDGFALIDLYWDTNSGGGVQKINGKWEWLPTCMPAGDPIYRCVFGGNLKTANENEWISKCVIDEDEVRTPEELCSLLTGPPFKAHSH
jgi:hypothetical protein